MAVFEEVKSAAMGDVADEAAIGELYESGNQVQEHDALSRGGGLPQPAPRIVPARFGEVAAIIHRAPPAVRRAAFVNEQPSASAIVGALPKLSGATAG
jgi:hypothetical protein